MNKKIEIKNIKAALNIAYNLTDAQLYNQLSFFRKQSLKQLIEHWIGLSQGESDFSSCQGWGYQKLGSNINDALRFLKGGSTDAFKNNHIIDWIKGNIDSSIQDWINEYSIFKKAFFEEKNNNNNQLSEVFKELSPLKNEPLLNKMIENPLLKNIMMAGADYSHLICDIEDFIFQRTQPVMILKTNKPYVKKGIKGISKDSILIPKDTIFVVQFVRCYDHGFYLDNKPHFSELLELKTLFNGDIQHLLSLNEYHSKNILTPSEFEKISNQISETI